MRLRFPLIEYAVRPFQRRGEEAERISNVPDTTAARSSPARAADSGLPGIGQQAARERRAAERHDADIVSRLRLPASEHDCQILDLSKTGMRVSSPGALVNMGEQVAIETQGFPLFLGTVSWRRDDAFGVQFARPLSDDVVAGLIDFSRRVRTPRAQRMALHRPAIAYFNGNRIEVVVCNIAVGGLMMATREHLRKGHRNLIQSGQALMIEFPELLPIGGHVRWTCGMQCGVMFSKPLRLSVAEDIVGEANRSSAFMDDVRRAQKSLVRR
jgi:hypothetical protein